MNTTKFILFLLLTLIGQLTHAQSDSLSRWSYQPSMIIHRHPNLNEIKLPHIEEFTVQTLKKPVNVNIGFDINFKLGKKRRLELFLSNEVHFSKNYVEQASWDNEKQIGTYTNTTKSPLAIAGYFGVRYNFHLGEKLSIAPSLAFPLYALGIQYRNTFVEVVSIKQTGAVYVSEGFSSGLGSDPYKVVGGFFAINAISLRLDLNYKLNEKLSLNTYVMPSFTKLHYIDGTKRKVGFHSIGIGLRYTPSLKKH